MFPTIREHLGEPVAPTGDKPDNRAVLGHRTGQRCADTGGGAGDQHPLSR